ncbi:hypothetical protein Rvan_2828 [Rhodomicrobium vannielii ATCC 17100]|uniref:Uncharacterized protein n=1 Tax=Rhodomicrobium vannielii (strain ATCC 17100 / DSM 162 / LMG 4299 / NCIMB 10020 / ATH 3.1.1) TaxID=648757 RepID=E3I8Q7_RHOVT|nr:hypothetical protein [Rhodomicrobium vannielii]ADP72036.1 hypothetical protein Rvan_2828 [Rhodomicrobium vannielii ATCC 17100]
MVAIVIAAEGPNAEKAAAVAADFFKEEFGVEAHIKVVGPDENEKFFEHIDPNWVAAILSIPGAILSSIELNQRLKLIERTNAMLTAIRQRLGTASGVIRIGSVKTLDLATIKAKELVDAILSAKEDGESR